MKSRRNLWTREQTIIAFKLYCEIPFGQAHSRNKEVKRVAELIGRTPGAVARKLGNFGSLDPELKARGVVGLTNRSHLDEEIWIEFNNNWNKLVLESSKLELKKSDYDDTKKRPEGRDKLRLVKTRVYQDFFRSAVLAAFENKCCITGINTQELLIASHIKPWKDDTKNRTNPQNGLALNALHDKAFDKGLITITPDYKVLVAQELLTDNKGLAYHFRKYNNKKIIKPHKFLPDKLFLEYHNDTIFRK